MNTTGFYSEIHSICFSFLTVLVREGERCEVIGFIKRGECLLRRHITVAHTFPNGEKVSVCCFEICLTMVNLHL